MLLQRIFVVAADVLSPWQWWLGRAGDREVLDDWRDRSNTELCSKYGQTSYMATIYQSLPTAHTGTIFPSHPHPVWVQLTLFRLLLFCSSVWVFFSFCPAKILAAIAELKNLRMNLWKWKRKPLQSCGIPEHFILASNFGFRKKKM